jgi:hypothetical protein
MYVALLWHVVGNASMWEVQNKAFGGVYKAACALLAIGEENNNHHNNNKYDRREKMDSCLSES